MPFVRCTTGFCKWKGEDRIMNIKRKIQLAACAVIVTSAFTMGFAPGAAVASSCDGGEFCDWGGLCPEDPEFACAVYAPPGCVVTYAVCTSNICAGGRSVVCLFAPE